MYKSTREASSRQEKAIAKSLNEQGFKEYINNIYTDINVVWHKTNNKDSEDVINTKVL